MNILPRRVYGREEQDSTLCPGRRHRSRCWPLARLLFALASGEKTRRLLRKEANTGQQYLGDLSDSVKEIGRKMNARMFSFHSLGLGVTLPCFPRLLLCREQATPDNSGIRWTQVQIGLLDDCMATADGIVRL